MLITITNLLKLIQVFSLVAVSNAIVKSNLVLTTKLLTMVCMVPTKFQCAENIYN